MDVSVNGGTRWVTIATFAAGTDAAYQPVSYDMSSYAASNTQIRFLSGTSNGNNHFVYIDNVQIVYTPTPVAASTQAALSCGSTLNAGGSINTYYPGTASIALGVTAIPVGAATGNSIANVS